MEAEVDACVKWKAWPSVHIIEKVQKQSSALVFCLVVLAGGAGGSHPFHNNFFQQWNVMNMGSGKDMTRVFDGCSFIFNF